MSEGSLIESRDDFLAILDRLLAEPNLGQQVENPSTIDYLESMAAWIRDTDGVVFADNHPLDTQTASWDLFAKIIQAALVYE